MGRVRTTAALCAVGLGVAVTPACTSGGDQEVRTDGDAAPVEFQAAVRETFRGTGAYRFSIDDDDASDATQTGEFSGNDIRGEVSWEGDDPVTVLVADDVSYMQIDDALTDLWGIDSSTVTGKQWLRTTPTPEEIEDLDLPEGLDAATYTAMTSGSMSLTGGVSAPQILSQLDGILGRAQHVRDDGTTTVDGRDLHRYVATLAGDEAFAIWGVDVADMVLSSAALWGDESEVDDALRAKSDAVADYLRDHVGMDLTVLANGDAVERVDIRVTETVEDKYEDCTFFTSSDEPDRMSFEFSNLGSDIAIAAPDPSEVASYADLSQASASGSFDQVGGTIEGGEDVIDTSDGGWTRDDLEESVIVEADRLGIDPVTVPGLPEDQLVALYERSLTLDGPMLDTASDGEMSRKDVLATVISGADSIDLDVATVPAMSDADLVAAYDRVIEKRYGPIDVGDDPAEWAGDDVFEACPGA